MNKLYFVYVGTTKDACFYENMDSKEPFNELKDNGIGFNDAQENKKELIAEENKRSKNRWKKL